MQRGGAEEVVRRRCRGSLVQRCRYKGVQVQSCPGEEVQESYRVRFRGLSLHHPCTFAPAQGHRMHLCLHGIVRRQIFWGVSSYFGF